MVRKIDDAFDKLDEAVVDPALNKVKGAAHKVSTLINKIIGLVKFLLTPLGQIIGILALVAALAAIIYVTAKTLEHALSSIFNDEYAGISTTQDYETIVGALGYSGYDSFISEQLWQEYAAFEYAVLMDVAEHMYEYQDYVTEIEDSRAPDGKYTTSAVIPEGFVTSEYDAESITKAEWQEYVVQGQGGGAPETIGDGGAKDFVGGNRNVTTPRLIYEVADHEYEDEAVSLIPYLVVVREDIELNYFIEGLEKSVWEGYENLEEIKVGDLQTAQSKLEPVRFSAELNRYNYNMPDSGYKKDLEDDQEGELVVGVEDPEGMIDADRLEGYGDDVYYIEQETDIVYKIPLKLLINRYLPKATMLTAWYMLKKDDVDGNGFKIEELMDEIKGVYNAACYQTDSLGIEEVKLTGKRDSKTGKIGPLDGSEGTETIRKAENQSAFERATVESVIFDDMGKMERDENGVIQTEQREIEFAGTNFRTFIYFEQFGLETSRYELYLAYRGTSGDNEPYSGDEARPEPISPSATYLTRDRTNFVKQLNLKFGTIWYIDSNGVTQPYTGLESSLKPTYILDSGLDEEDRSEIERLDEKLKSLYVYEGKSNVRVNQEEPYEFMKKVRETFEYEIFKNMPVNKPSGEDEYIYDHFESNQYYLIAEIGNSGEIAQIEKDNGRLEYSTSDIEFRLPEDYRYYNQDDIMPHWYDLKEYEDTQKKVEDGYLDAFRLEYNDRRNENDEAIKAMLKEELIAAGCDVVKIVSYDSQVDYYGTSAKIYDGGEHVKGDKAVDVKDNTEYKINYYWEGVYTIEEKELQMRQKIHHRRMPVALVKYADTWAKSVEYENTITQNPLNYRSYKYLIPESKTSLGLKKMELIENPKYRVSTYADFFNKTENSENAVVKEADVLDMLVQWEEYGNNGNEATYAYMRDLYKLTLFIRDSGSMLKNAYTYLYIPSTISNFDDATTQKIFWLERLGVSQGEDELNEDEQNVTRTKGIEIHWQNLEYDEYYECIVDTSDGGEDAKVYAMFPFGAPVIRAYYMLNNINNLTQNGFKGAAHPATDIYARAYAKEILDSRVNGVGDGSNAEHIYFYELNRLTLSYMRNGNNKEDAFLLAEKELNETLEQYRLYSPIVAIAPGYVTAVDYDARSGFYVKIAHDYKPDEEEKDNAVGDATEPQLTSFYAHFKRWPLVDVGDYVGAGTVLGYEGTTGRSTGNHLHIEIKINGYAKDPHVLITPVFSPFYYAEKAKAIVEEDASKALGSEYYKLERTILLEDGLFNGNNVINGMTMENGDVINYNGRNNRSGIYNSGDSYEGAAYANVIWGNNVPMRHLASDVSEIMDLNLLNQTIPYKPEDCDTGDGGKISLSKTVTSNPKYFEIKSDFVKERLEWPEWFAVAMAEYKSSLVVPYYNGPRSQKDTITEEGLEDLKAMQRSLKKAGYYNKAGVKWDESGYGTYSDAFVEVVKEMQKDLAEKGYDKFGIGSDGNLDVNTVNAYNTMMQYTSSKNQFAMAEKTTYNSSVDLSIEPALLWAMAVVEGGYGDEYLALKESEDPVSDPKELEYMYYSTEDKKYKFYDKQFNREQGIMQISPDLAIERYKEDKVKEEDAVLFIRAPMRNTNIGIEIFKEYAIELYLDYSGDIDCEKNKIVFGGGGSEYWRKVFEDCSKFEKDRIYGDGWVDPENIDRLMLYAIALDAYDKEGTEDVNVNEIITNEPTSYGKEVLEKFKNFVLDLEEKGIS